MFPICNTPIINLYLTKFLIFTYGTNVALYPYKDEYRKK